MIDVDYGNGDDARSLEELVKDHYAGVVATDENAGRIIGALEKSSILDDTVIMLSSGHGIFLGEWSFFKPFETGPCIVRHSRIARLGRLKIRRP